jgi:predicted nucleic acid-binding protein
LAHGQPEFQIMKPKVYVETSVIGYLTSWPSGDLIIAARQKITYDWWRDAATKYELLISDAVRREASAGDPQAVNDRLAAIQGLPELPVTQVAADLADALLLKAALPTSEPQDALHIAMAAVYGLEYLVTWNFKHIANPTMRQKIIDLCVAEGFGRVTICTPEDLREAQ